MDQIQGIGDSSHASHSSNCSVVPSGDDEQHGSRQANRSGSHYWMRETQSGKNENR